MACRYSHAFRYRSFSRLKRRFVLRMVFVMAYSLLFRLIRARYSYPLAVAQISSRIVTRDSSYVPKLRIRHPLSPTTYSRIRSGLYSYLRSVAKISATYCLVTAVIQSRYGVEISAVGKAYKKWRDKALRGN